MNHVKIAGMMEPQILILLFCKLPILKMLWDSIQEFIPVDTLGKTLSGKDLVLK